VAGCKTVLERQDVRPRFMRDVPAQRLSYRLEADTNLPAEIRTVESVDKIEAIQTDFNTRRPDDALLRTVGSPDGRRALALYGTEDQPGPAFRIDIYSLDGKFLKNLIPPDLSCVFPETVAWSPDGNFITFIAHKSVKPSPTPTPPGLVDEATPEPSPLPSVAPAFPAVALFDTEQIYICNRDGYDLKPLTGREGLIYFYYLWAPDNHAVVALACKESEWDAREKEFKLPAGRPRLITADGQERLLDDELTEALPVWSTDSAKVATAFDTDVAIYDAASNSPTQARIHLRDSLVAASIAYDEKHGRKAGGRNETKGTANSQKSTGQASGAAQPVSESEQQTPAALPASFNPIVRLEWPMPETLYFQTAFVRLMPSEAINTFQRWHRLTLSPQTAVLR